MQQGRYEKFIRRQVWRRMILHQHPVDPQIAQDIVEFLADKQLQAEQVPEEYRPMLTEHKLIGGPMHLQEILSMDRQSLMWFPASWDPGFVRYRADEAHQFNLSFRPGIYMVYARGLHNDPPHDDHFEFYYQGLYHSSRPDIFGAFASPTCTNPLAFYGV